MTKVMLLVIQALLDLSTSTRSPTIGRKWVGSGHVCMYICIYVCMGFANTWRFKAPSESRVVTYDSHMNSTLLRHAIIGMR